MMQWVVRGAVLAAGIVAILVLVDAEGQVPLALALLWSIAFLWVTETLHITVTALLVPVLAVALGLMTVPAALVNFAHPIIFLFLGGFALAAAMHVQGLDRWLAHAILRGTQGRLDRAVLLLAAATAVLSMWVSNTAVTALMLPLILGLLSQKPDLSLRTEAFSLLAIAYSANVGGMGTIIGSPPNAIVAAELGLDFVDWLKIGMPVVAVMWPLVLAVMYAVLRPDFQGGRVALSSERLQWTGPRRTLLVVFALAVIGWLFGGPLSSWLGIAGDMDSWVALTVIVLLATTGVVSWKQIEHSADWGVLLLFGGGLTLSAVLRSSGASEYLGLGLAHTIGGWGALFVLLSLLAFVVFLTEITSNTATTALLVPVFVALPAGIIEPTHAALAIGLAASCAFMLPVATPPNALVHGTGRVGQQTMIRTGFALNLLCILVLAAILSLFGH